MTESHRFEVGEKYENMKGVFEVIAIGKDSMDIRWEDGEEISTSIALQQRIIERMQHESEMAGAQASQAVRKAKPAAAAGARPFSGFGDDDFSLAVTKTLWRGRGQLGGAVSRRMIRHAFRIDSWAVLGKPEIHWLDKVRQKQEDLAWQAKFYARVEKAALCFGFHLPKPEPVLPPTSDWSTLTRWLSQPQNDAWLRRVSQSDGLYVCDLTQSGFGGTLEPRQQHWVAQGSDDTPIDAASLGAFLAVVGGEIVDLRIERRISKTEAVEQGPGIAETIAGVFGTLMPVYAVAVARGV